MKHLQSSAQGALVGLAVGDALGTTLEFSQRDSRPALLDMIGGGPFKLAPGQWTDDTSMALCLADSLLNCHRHDPIDQLERYVRWWRQGENSVTGHCFDIGMTVSRALQCYMDQHEPYPGLQSEHSAGNGSLMRLAPIAIFYSSYHSLRDEKAALSNLVEMARRSSMTTHRHPLAVSACQVMSLFIDHAMAALAPDENEQPSQHSKRSVLTLSDLELSLLGTLPAEIAAIVAGSYRNKRRDEIRSSGYVVHSLEAALWAFWHSQSFAQGALLAANLGDDADTVAAIYGQLAGAYYGIDAIPAEWLKKLAWSERLIGLAATLSDRNLHRVPQDDELLVLLETMQRSAQDDTTHQGSLFLELVYECGVMQPDGMTAPIARQVFGNGVSCSEALLAESLLWGREECCCLLGALARASRFNSFCGSDGIAVDIESGVIPVILLRLATLLGTTFHHPYLPTDVVEIPAP
ncbi:ADP-ribosylglycohydrolase family protein [Aeromonas veronii]